jgi:hypothetical protein
LSEFEKRGDSCVFSGSDLVGLLQFCNFHWIKTDERELEHCIAKASAGKLALVLAGKKPILAEQES